MIPHYKCVIDVAQPQRGLNEEFSSPDCVFKRSSIRKDFPDISWKFHSPKSLFECILMSTSFPLVGPGLDSTSPHNSIRDQRYNKVLIHVLYILIQDLNGWEDPTHSTISPSRKPEYIFCDNSGQKAISTELNSGCSQAP